MGRVHKYDRSNVDNFLRPRPNYERFYSNWYNSCKFNFNIRDPFADSILAGQPLSRLTSNKLPIHRPHRRNPIPKFHRRNLHGPSQSSSIPRRHLDSKHGRHRRLHQQLRAKHEHQPRHSPALNR
jgi:hypothetical protein